MDYQRVVEATFRSRPNRFIAHVTIGSHEEVVHVKNTGRCRELLVPGARVILEEGTNPKRRTRYSLIAVYKGDRLINMDSQAPNEVVYEALLKKQMSHFDCVLVVKREETYGRSRFDMYFTSQKQSGYIEVKGVTLEQDGIAMFPDAPTERGTKHVLELIEAANKGYAAYLVFLIQMAGVRHFTTNAEMDAKFAAAVRKAANAGVRILAYDTLVRPSSLVLGDEIPIRL